MPEQGNATTTPVLEEVIRERLSEETRQSALDFVAHLRAGDEREDLTIRYDNQYGENIWLAKVKNDIVCFILVSPPDSPELWMHVFIHGNLGESAAMAVEERVREAAWANMTSCGNCGAKCGPEQRRRTVFGRAFDNVCTDTLRFFNPDAAAFNCIKTITDIRKSDITNMA